jgi:site-specific recombinase XerD
VSRIHCGHLPCLDFPHDHRSTLADQTNPRVASVNRDLRRIRAAIRWAKRRDYITDVPDFKGYFIREDRKKPVIISEEDFAEMVKALRKPDLALKYRPADWWRIFLHTVYYLGLRRGEIWGSPGTTYRWRRSSTSCPPASKSRKEPVVSIPYEFGPLLI